MNLSLRLNSVRRKWIAALAVLALAEGVACAYVITLNATATFGAWTGTVVYPPQNPSSAYCTYTRTPDKCIALKPTDPGYDVFNCVLYSNGHQSIAYGQVVPQPGGGYGCTSTSPVNKDPSSPWVAGANLVPRP